MAEDIEAKAKRRDEIDADLDKRHTSQQNAVTHINGFLSNPSQEALAELAKKLTEHGLVLPPDFATQDLETAQTDLHELIEVLGDKDKATKKPRQIRNDIVFQIELLLANTNSLRPRLISNICERLTANGFTLPEGFEEQDLPKIKAALAELAENLKAKNHEMPEYDSVVEK